MGRAVRGMIVAVILAAFVPWVAAPSSVHASTAQGFGYPAGCTPSTSGFISSDCAVSLVPVPTTVLLGQTTTVSLTCDAVAASYATSAPAGCYNVQAVVEDVAAPTDPSFTPGIAAAQCGGVATTPFTFTDAGGSTSSQINCANVTSPICPVTTTGGGTAPCASSGATGSALVNQASVTFSPANPHLYRVTFFGYMPSDATGSCPAGTTSRSGPSVLTVSGSGSLPVSGNVCQFTLQTFIYPLEINNVGISSSPSPCNETVAPDSSSTYYGPPCIITAAPTGTVELKTVPSCSGAPTGTVDPSSPLYPGTYSCITDSSGSSIWVTGVPSADGGTLTFTASGPGSWKYAVNLSAGTCTGDPSTQTFSEPNIPTRSATLCPTGFGTGTVTACFPASVNLQPQVCSASLPFTYTTASPAMLCTGGSAASGGQNVTIPSGASCAASDLTINKDLTVQPGASLSLTGASIGHDANVQGAASVQLANVSVQHNLNLANNRAVSLCGVSVNHDVTIQNLGPGATVTIGNPPTCAGNSFSHDVTIANIQGMVAFSGNTVGHDASFQHIQGSTTITNNQIGHALTCSGNSPTQTASGNAAGHGNTCGG